MVRTTKRLCLAIVAACLLPAACRPAAAGVIFDNTIGRGAPDGVSKRPSSNPNQVSPGTNISAVATDTVITGIGVLTKLNDDQDLKFLIFDQTSTSPLYESAAKSFSGDETEATWKVSDPFSFTLLAGHQYYIGAVMNGLAGFPYYDGGVYTQNGITSNNTNINFTSFDNPLTGKSGDVYIPLRLYGDVVPEPSSMALSAIAALAGAGALAGRRTRTRASS